MQSLFSIEFGAPIWDVRSNGHLIMITERDEEKQQVLFSLFDPKAETFLWEQIRFEEEWWVSLVYLAQDAALFQIFNDTQDIELQSIFAVDLKSLEVLWQHENTRYLSASDNQVTLVANGEEKRSLDILSGEFLDVDAEPASGHGNLSYPSHFEETSSHFKTLQGFITKHINKKASGSFEYFQNDDFFVVSANFEGETGYSNELFVFSVDGELLLREKLDQDLKGLASGTFFIVNRELIFVKGKKELLAYSI